MADVALDANIMIGLLDRSDVRTAPRRSGVSRSFTVEHPRLPGIPQHLPFAHPGCQLRARKGSMQSGTFFIIKIVTLIGDNYLSTG